jgi:tetratricopeptide (TPR) repeat protein
MPTPQRDLSVSYGNLGKVSLETGEVPKALDAFQKCLEISNRRAQADPTDAVAQQDLMLSQHQLGEVHRSLFAYAKAIERYRAGSAVLERMIEAGQNVEQSRRSLSILERKEKMAEQAKIATSNWETVLEQATKTPVLLYHRAAEFAKQRKFDAAAQAAAKFREIAQAATDDKADHLYNAACAYGLCAAAVQPAKEETLTEAEQARRTGYLDLSLVCLKEAVAVGYDNFEDARKDSDLAVLRDLPEFQKLIKSPPEDSN